MNEVANGVGVELTEEEVKVRFADLIVKVPEVVAQDTLKRVHDWFENSTASWKDPYILQQVSYLHRIVDRPL